MNQDELVHLNTSHQSWFHFSETSGNEMWVMITGDDDNVSPTCP